MELILISILLLLVFGFIGLITLGYAITMWEQKKLEDMAKNLHSKKVDFAPNHKHKFSTVESNYSHDMKPSQKVGHYLERSLVLVKNQDYQGWLNKTTTVVKKVSSNLELYTKFAWNKFMQLITKDYSKGVNDNNDFGRQEGAKQVDQTIDKINLINQKNEENSETATFVNTNTLSGNLDTDLDFVEHQNTSNKYQNNSSATLDIASDHSKSTQNNSQNDKKAKDEIYEKIEANILQRLKETGLSHYDIWLELGKHYEKYGENEKAIEIYSMVMKNSQGREKDIARDGLIALS
jgi:hypothetical protein